MVFDVRSVSALESDKLSCKYNSRSGTCNTFNLVSNLNATYDQSLLTDFEIDLEAGSLTLKKKGFYAFSFSSTVNRSLYVYIGLQGCTSTCIIWMENGDKITFKTSPATEPNANGILIVKRI